PAGKPSSDPGSAYSFDETEFLTLYNRALEQRKTGKKPSSPAPQDPSETGFGVLPLDRETYGTSAYAFLPLQERALTEEEMLQLAWGMEGLSGEELLKPEHARTGLFSYDGAERLFANRAVTRQEEAALLRLTPRYFYEGMRASLPKPGAQEEGLPVTVKLDGEDQFAVLPQEDMTEEGLLRYLEVKFARLRPEDYLPLPEEISYGQLPEFLSSALLRYGIGDGTLPEYCALLLQNSGAQRTPEERRASEENWQVTLLYPEGDEYVVGLRSDTGELYGWARYPNGTFTAGTAAVPSHAGTLREEELLEKAKGYLQELCPGEGEYKMAWQGERRTFFEETGKCVWVEQEDGRSAELVLLPDGTIQSFTFL
ncbi:hypothetical protein, partial [Neglectibacter timonensis]